MRRKEDSDPALSTLETNVGVQLEETALSRRGRRARDSGRRHESLRGIPIFDVLLRNTLVPIFKVVLILNRRDVCVPVVERAHIGRSPDPPARQVDTDDEPAAVGAYR